MSEQQQQPQVPLPQTASANQDTKDPYSPRPSKVAAPPSLIAADDHPHHQPPPSRLIQHSPSLDTLTADPNYDHDAAIAHGIEELMKMRTLSVSHIPQEVFHRRPQQHQQQHSPLQEQRSPIIGESEKHRRRRRASHDVHSSSHPTKLILGVKETQERILKQEDTDGDFQITVTDGGPKMLPVGTYSSRGHRTKEIRGHYALANLLQELALADDHGRNVIVLDEKRLHENPVDRLSRMIKYHFWDGLTRRIDGDGLERICLDPKNRSANHRPRIYVPHDDPQAMEYFTGVAARRPHLNLEVVRLPERITPEYVRSINHLPGILSLALQTRQLPDGGQETRGVPFVVPGGRFNEMYGWDSYFETLGLLVDGRVGLSRAMVDNFAYEIKHYGKILNANRSYYLTRSQPPFLTDMALRIYERLSPEKVAENKEWLAHAFRAVVKEYYSVWMSAPRYVPEYGLNRYHGEGLGMPPETEASHFDHVLEPFAQRYEVDIPTFTRMYNNGEVREPELDEYFIHDRAVRESGHDTTYRLAGKCANVLPIDLNCLLYKYEIDIGNTIRDVFEDSLVRFDGQVENSAVWFERAATRRRRINELLWNEERGLFFDFDIKEGSQNLYETVTVFFALWSGMASPEQAQRLVDNLALFEVQGGLVCGTEESRGEISLSRPNRQWDYPFGWAPHQMVAWKGLADYGHTDVARRLAYRWLYTITKSFVDFNGVVPEKFDVVTLNHRVKVEYGNVGVDFKMIPREGFGWMNSSYKVGLTYITTHMRRALGTLVHPNTFFAVKSDNSKKRRSV